MSDETRGPRGAEPLLLLEAGLVLVLFALFVFLFLLPSARPPFTPGWWNWPLVALVFFALVGVDAFRRKRGRRAPSRPRSPRRPDEPVPPAA